MNKLEKLGGLEGLRKKLSSMGSWSEKQSLAIDALMSEIEALTAERDQFQKLYEDAFKRVEELERQLQAARDRDFLKMLDS